MKISRSEFISALESAIQGKDNYRRNLEHNAGQWNYWPIYRVEVNGVMFYCAACCKTANSSLAAVKRVCACN